MKNKQDAFNRALHYLSYKMRTAKEIRDYLKKKEYEPDQIEQALLKLSEYHLIDDRQYAEYYIREKFSVSGHGRHKMYYQLIHKGISAEIVKNEIDRYFADHSEEEKIKELFLKKSKTINTNEPKEIYKIYNFLIRKGFPAEKVRNVVKKHTDFNE